MGEAKVWPYLRERKRLWTEITNKDDFRLLSMQIQHHSWLGYIFNVHDVQSNKTFRPRADLSDPQQVKLTSCFKQNGVPFSFLSSLNCVNQRTIKSGFHQLHMNASVEVLYTPVRFTKPLL